MNLKKNNNCLNIYCFVIIIVIAFIITAVSFRSLSTHGEKSILADSTHQGQLVIGMSLGFVRAYSNFEAQYAKGLLPNPAIFRSHGLELANLTDGITSDVVGLPGRSIKKEPTDKQMIEQMLMLSDSAKPKISTSILDKQEGTIHRSIWPFFAVDETCINCHNSVQQLTGNDRWNLGDLMGAQVVEKNISSDLKSLRHQTLFTCTLIFFVIIAVFCSIVFVLRLFSLTKEFKLLATTDTLTGCINRREMYTRVSKFKHRVTGAIFMVDIDKFKNINDSLGHAAGDHVIRDLANILRKNIRENDWVARLGGEEFLIWLPDITSDEAYNLAERLRKITQKSNCTYNKEPILYTVSIGLYTCSNASSINFDKWVNTADKYLYEAKTQGRNRVIAQ